MSSYMRKRAKYASTHLGFLSSKNVFSEWREFKWRAKMMIISKRRAFNRKEGSELCFCTSKSISQGKLKCGRPHLLAKDNRITVLIPFMRYAWCSIRYVVCGKKGTYHFCVSTIPSIHFLLQCRICYAVWQNESLHVAIHVANLYEFRWGNLRSTGVDSSGRDVVI